jgi:hypothetical protein
MCKIRQTWKACLDVPITSGKEKSFNNIDTRWQNRKMSIAVGSVLTVIVIIIIIASV